MKSALQNWLTLTPPQQKNGTAQNIIKMFGVFKKREIQHVFEHVHVIKLSMF